MTQTQTEVKDTQEGIGFCFVLTECDSCADYQKTQFALKHKVRTNYEKEERKPLLNQLAEYFYSLYQKDLEHRVTKSIAPMAMEMNKLTPGTQQKALSRQEDDG